MFEVLTDDCDIDENALSAFFGGNGDIYIEISHTDEYGIKSSHSVRIATSGGKCPTNIKIASAELARAFEENDK